MFHGDELERAPCPTCGARTVDEAETLCRPTQDQSGEYSCAGSAHEEDAEGFLRQPTEAALKRLDEWVTEQARAEGWIT